MPPLRKTAGRLAAPVASQGVAAATSLVLQVIAARGLGLAEFGAFAVLLGLLVAATALYVGYVGDSLAVLDRHDRTVRAALVSSAAIAIAGCCAVGAVTVLVMRGGDVALAVGYPVLLLCWLVRETLRRLLVARQEFTALLINDCGYLVLTLAAVAVVAATAGLSLGGLVAAMAAGAVVTFAAGAAQLPRAERAALTPGWDGIAEVARFASWRAGHAALRPLALLAARVLVGAFGSLAAVGVFEAGRLVVAPLQVVVNGIGSYLLAGYAVSERDGTLRPTVRTAWLLGAATAACAVPFVVLAGPLGRLLTGHAVDPLLVLGWSAYLVVWAAGLPAVLEVVARRLSRPVFLVRLTDSLAGLTLLSAALFAGAGVTVAPWLLAAGGVYSVLRIHVLAKRTRAAVLPQVKPDAVRKPLPPGG